MRSVAMSAWLVVAALASSAWAKLYKTHEEVMAAAQKSGKLVLIIYNRTVDQEETLTKQMRDRMLRFAATQTNHFEVAEIDPFRNRGHPQLNKFINGMRARKSISGGNLLLPIWAVGTPDGELIGGGDYDTIKKGGLLKWRAAVSALPRRYPRLSEKDRRQAERLLDEAKQETTKGRYYEAYAIAHKLERVWFPKKFVDAREGLQDQIKDKGDEEIAKADQLSGEGKFLEAALAYARVKRRFTMRLPAGPKASRKLVRLLSQHKEIKERYERAAQDEEAQELLGLARDLAKKGDAVKARAAYRTLATRFAETPSAVLAKDEMDKLGVTPKTVGTQTTPQEPKEGPPSVQTGDAEAKASRLVRMAKNYRNMGMKQKAAEKCKACVAAYPKTKAASEAKKLLQQMGME